MHYLVVWVKHLITIMTWHTNLGTRTLTRAEAVFYLQLLKEIVDESRDMAEMGYKLEIETGDRIFDNASFEQRVVLWHQCLKALLKPDVAPPISPTSQKLPPISHMHS